MLIVNILRFVLAVAGINEDDSVRRTTSAHCKFALLSHLVAVVLVKRRPVVSPIETTP